MDTELRINLNKQVYVVGHDFELDQFRSGFGDDVLKDLLEALFVDSGSQNRTSILRAPHYVVLAAKFGKKRSRASATTISAMQLGAASGA